MNNARNSQRANANETGDRPGFYGLLPDITKIVIPFISLHSLLFAVGRFDRE
jgi:hypothetical protein